MLIVVRQTRSTVVYPRSICLYNYMCVDEGTEGRKSGKNVSQVSVARSSVELFVFGANSSRLGMEGQESGGVVVSVPGELNTLRESEEARENERGKTRHRTPKRG